MRILIDECLDWRLGHALTGQDSVSVQKMGWGGIKNGRLLALPQAEFDTDDAADALAVAICHAHHRQWARTLARAV